jgi:hypothetical protein
MNTTTMIVLNVAMSLLAFGAVAAGAAIGYRLRSVSDGHRAGWRGAVLGRTLAAPRRPQRTAASSAVAANSSAR